MQYERATGQSDDSGLITSSMIKLAKDGEKKEESSSFPSWRIFLIYRKWFMNLSLNFGKKIS